MNRIVKTLALAAPILSAALLTPRTSDACGGCFVPPSSSTVVTGHRMALSVSTQRTVLWDQIQYQGNPEDFSWVLPVKPGAVIELADNAWFEALEASTVTTVQAPQLNCNQGGTTPFGCGASGGFASAAADFEGGGDNGGVQVVKQETVGPYDSVTLSSEDPAALTDWLESHGYDIPDDVEPIIATYVEEGFDFIALRLTPGNGVNLMAPVRVITEGASPALPLRMVAAGTGPFTSIILFVIGEGRWTTDNFFEVLFPWDALVWDGEKNDSNYAELRSKVLGLDGGRAWIAPYAQPNALFGWNDGAWAGGGIAYTYVRSLVDDTGANWEQASACEGNMGGLGTSTSVVVEPACDPATGECADVGSGKISSKEFECGGLTDLSTALVGMHPKDVWVTRLEANLPRYALDVDLQLRAHDQQTPVANFHLADESVNYQCPAVPPNGTGSKNAPTGNGTAVILVGLGAVAALLAARRRPFLGAAIATRLR